MPVDIDVFDRSSLRVEIVNPTFESQIVHVLRSLLNSQYRSGFWTVDWQDFKQLRSYLNRCDLKSGRTATDKAAEWIEEREAVDERVENIKKGLENEQVRVQDLVELKTKLYEDQVAGVRFLSTRKRALIADEMGCGKSIEILAAFLILRQTTARRAIVICPNNVKVGWVKEVEKHTTLTVRAIGNGSAQAEEDTIAFAKDPTDVLVVHYDALVNTTIRKSQRTVEWSILVDLLCKLPWDAIIIDEAHQLKNTGTKRNKAMEHFVETAKNRSGESPHLYLATGTPVSESPLDAWSVLSFLDPKSLPSRRKFENQFTVKVKKRGRFRHWTEIVGYRNLGELKGMLHHVMIRRLKNDIRGMPDKVLQTRYVLMGAEQRAVYDEMRKKVLDEVTEDLENDKMTVATAMTRLLRLRQILCTPELLDVSAPSAKFEELDSILEEVLADPTAKVLIWTEWRQSAALLAKRYWNSYGTIELVGGTSQEQLCHYSQNWDTMSERVAVAIPAFAGTGTDWLQRCRTAIYVEPPYSTVLFRQSVDRIHRRVGDIRTDMDKLKASPAMLIFMQIENSIDKLVYDRVHQKGELVDSLLTEDEKLTSLGKEDLLWYLSL